MSAERDPVHDAIDRWQEKGLVDAATADTLRDEVDRDTEAASRRSSQYVLAATAAVVLVIASAIFVDWAWPRLDLTTRVGLLVGVGVGLHLWGSRVEVRFAWKPAGYLMQVAGLAVVLVALPYSESAWSDRSVPALALGVGGLAFAMLSAVRAMARNPVMPAAHVAFGLLYLGFFLDRGLGLSEAQVVWTLDGALLVLTAVLVRILSRDRDGQAHPWALNAMVAALYTGFVLISWTTFGLLHWNDAAVVAVDVWFGVLVALNVWGIHGAPPGLRRAWFGRHLAYLCLIWIPLGFWTADEVLGGGAFGWLVLVGGAGVAAFVYATRQGMGALMRSGALAFIVAVWVWAVDQAGAMGAVLALALTAGLLFWLSGRTAPLDVDGDAGQA